MRIVCTSDVHGRIAGMNLPPGDVLVIAGDVLGDFKGMRGERAAETQLRPLGVDYVGIKPLEATLPMFALFLEAVPFEHVVLVAGNHDWAFQFRRRKALAMLPGKVRYLQDSGTEIDGVRFWGSPWQPEYHGWAFNLPRDGEDLAEAWSLIPEGLDVLVTHGPPAGILDQPHGMEPPVGDRLLMERVLAAKPRFHVFGHIHGSYGTKVVGETTFMNVAACGEENTLANAPRVILLEGGSGRVMPLCLACGATTEGFPRCFRCMGWCECLEDEPHNHGVGPCPGDCPVLGCPKCGGTGLCPQSHVCPIG